MELLQKNDQLLSGYGYQVRIADFWKFVFQRNEVFMRRFADRLPAERWYDGLDLLFKEWKFCNVVPFLDRGTQFILHEIHEDLPDDKLFRILVYRIFNKMETFEAIDDLAHIKTWDTKAVLERISKVPVAWGNAFMMTGFKFAGYEDKTPNYVFGVLDPIHKNIERIFQGVKRAKSLREIHAIISDLTGYGNFLAYVAIWDLCYSRVVEHSLDSWAFVGPGARKAINRILGKKLVSDEQYYRYLTELRFMAKQSFQDLSLPMRYFDGKELDLACVETSLCEYSKFATIREGSLHARRRHFVRGDDSEYLLLLRKNMQDYGW